MTGERLRTVAESTALISVALPWHLKVEVDLPGGTGQSPIQGTIERWQAGEDYRTVSVFGSSTSTVLEHDGKHYAAMQGEPVPDAADAVLHAILHPGPSNDDMVGVTAELRKQSLGKVTLECIMLSRPIPRVAFAPLGLFPTYCLTAGDHLNVSYDFGSETVIRTAFGKFLDREVTVGVTVMDGERVIARGKVTQLATFTRKEHEFEPTAELAASPVSTRVSGGVMAGMILQKPQPVYPVSARQNRVSGTVVLLARIGTDGHVHSLRPISAPNPDLAISAIAAVRQWTYKPFTLNGVPTDVQTTITVNYNLN